MGIENVIFGRVFMIAVLLLLVYAVVIYVLTAKSLYMIAGRRGIANPWMAWVPVANTWILGSLSDQYKTRKYGYDPELRRPLLILSIISQGGSLLINSLNLYNNAFTHTPMVLVSLIALMIVTLVFLGVSIAQTVYQLKAYYSLYASCKPQLAVLFLVLRIVTPAGPFLTYACRDDDAGLPPENQI